MHPLTVGIRHLDYPLVETGRSSVVVGHKKVNVLNEVLELFIEQKS